MTMQGRSQPLAGVTTYNFTKFFEKLHELGGSPLDPPLQYEVFFLTLTLIRFRSLT